jgi:hypothetical protein
MNDEERAEFIKMLREHREIVSKDKKLSREFLIKAGIYTKSGKLSKHYRHLCIPSGQD